MIEGFEKETAELNDFEMEKIFPVLKKIIFMTNEEHPITNIDIRKNIYLKTGNKLPGWRIRKIINYMRHHISHYVILASSKGYWVSTDAEKIKAHIKSLRQRALSILSVANSEAKMLEFLTGSSQQNLFTNIQS
jgi:hypothetical protein